MRAALDHPHTPKRVMGQVQSLVALRDDW